MLMCFSEIGLKWRQHMGFSDATYSCPDYAHANVIRTGDKAQHAIPNLDYDKKDVSSKKTKKEYCNFNQD